METKKIILASAIIAVVVVASVVGIVAIMIASARPGGFPSTEHVPSTSIKVKYWNGTEKEVKVFHIVDAIVAGDINAISFVDTTTTGKGYNVTGVNIVELLNHLGFHAPWGVKISNSTGSFSTDVSLMINSDGNMVKNPQTTNPLILGIAAHQMWLNGSPLGEAYGNFALFGGDLSATQAIMDITEIEITSEWTLPVYVNGLLNYTINSETILDGDYGTSRWWYDDNGTSYFDWNCTIKGRTLNDIIGQTSASGLPYNVTWSTIDGFVWPKAGYNHSDVQSGLDDRAIVNCTLDEVGDCVAGTGVKMPIDGLYAPDGNLMWITNEEIQHQSAGNGNPTPLKLLDGGPYKLIVPGQIKKGYNKWLTRIDIEI